MEKIISQFQSSIDLMNVIISDKRIIDGIIQLKSKITATLLAGNKVIFAGNGGSFSDAQHLSAELAGRFMIERRPLSGICLGTNSSLVTAIGNDYDFETIFARELEAIGLKGDLFIPISSSGNSKNLIKALDVANNKDIEAFCLLGRDGGSMANMCQGIIVPSSHTARIQEIHIKIGNIICDLVDAELFDE